MYFSKREFSCQENFSRELLQNFTAEEKSSLSNIFKGIFYSSAFGYTLFGDKPISVICDSGRPYENGELSFFQKHLFNLAQRYEKKLNAPHFAIVVEDFASHFSIYLVNKRAFINTVQENILIFRSTLGDSITPGSLLSSVLDKNHGFEGALKGNHALLGILFGFGAENSLRFNRRDQLDPPWLRQRFPPWKGSQGDIQGSDFIEPQWAKVLVLKGLDTVAVPEKIVLSPQFSTVQDELSDLNKKLLFVAGAEEVHPAILSSILLPSFVGDPGSEETRKLVEKYEAQRSVLMKMIAEDKFIEKVLEKFFSTEGD